MIRYEAVLSVENADNVRILDLGCVGETAQVWINDTYVGATVNAPFCLDVSGVLKRGDNRIRIDVMTNLGYAERDMFSKFVLLPPTGLAGPVCIG